MFILSLLACTESPVGLNEIGPTFIEVYNPRDEAVDFAGWSVEVDGERWTFDAGTVAPGSVSYAAGADDTEATWTLDLELPTQGGMLTVYDAERRRRQVIQLPVLDARTSFGRLPDGSANWQVVEPTPGMLNDAGG